MGELAVWIGPMDYLPVAVEMAMWPSGILELDRLASTRLTHNKFVG